MKKYITEWSFADNCLRFYESTDFFSENKTKIRYEMRSDGFYSNVNGKFIKLKFDQMFDEIHERLMFIDDITNDSVFYVKGTFFDNLLICDDLNNRLMSFFDTLLFSFKHVGLIIEERLLDGLSATFPGFKEAWNEEVNNQRSVGKIISFKIESLAYHLAD